MADLLDIDMPPEAIPQLPVGIHFNVPDEVYFAQDALGSTDKKELAVDPVEWQFKRLHGEDVDTKAKIWGSGMHCRVLEGEKAFVSRFGVLPNKEDNEGLLVTKEDLVGWLKAEGAEFKSSALKGDLVRLVRTIDPSAPVWDAIVADFEGRYPENRRLTWDMADEIELAASWMQADEMISPIMRGGSFVFGASELTVIYDVDDVRCRARFDHLIPGRIIDLKRYSPWRNGGALEGIVQAIGNYRYDLQAADYINAFEHGARLFREGKVFGTEPFDGFLEKTFGAGEMPKWVWVLVKGVGAPQPRVVELPTTTTVFKIAQTQIETAINNYRTNRDRFGLDKDWRPAPGAFLLADEDFPSWHGRF